MFGVVLFVVIVVVLVIFSLCVFDSLRLCPYHKQRYIIMALIDIIFFFTVFLTSTELCPSFNNSFFEIVFISEKLCFFF